MKKLMKSILITLLLLLGMGLTTLLAAQTVTTAKDTLVIKQFSIDSPGEEFREQLSPSEGRLTFRILAGTTTGLEAEQILQWLKNGTMRVSDIRFDTDQAIAAHENKLSVPFEFEYPLRGEYLEAELRLSGLHWIEDAATTVSLYGGSHGVVDLSLIGGGKRLAGGLVSNHNVSAVDFMFEPVATTLHYQPVHLTHEEKPEDKNRRGGFLVRNKYWVMGAATIVASSTTALLMSGGDSVTYLPEPPGRP